MKKWKNCLLMIIAVVFLFGKIPVYASMQGESVEPQVTTPSYVLMEASTGQVIVERGSNEKRSPASITKIMTLLLVFEALDQGKIKLTDEVITSEYAKSMGGSQVFLETGEIQTVDTLIKCIAVASGNDASVAMAEYIAGSEEEFVSKMNQKAQQIGMKDTKFEDCCGLTDSEGHYTTAKDVAIMSRELILRYPNIYKYTKIWMEDIVHTTQKGSANFTLASTNKLLKQYEWTTGLKTGSTDKAKYCLSATANKNGIDLIAVVMAAPDYKIRFEDARTLLNHGFSVSQVFEDKNDEKLPTLKVRGGVIEEVAISYETMFRYLDITGADVSKIEKKIELPEEGVAPLQKGGVAGKVKYTLQGKLIGSVDIIYDIDVKKAVYVDYLKKVLTRFCLAR